ncbi:hypothetical protein [Paraburkholderia elongata]|uniref:Uncharacterized protein n=1 Tax=Paraburkholderia elongata TaxID=2675747 RepID=A0A972NWN2_9BURK|nr:hypothetical protein [Paraburkholderia elongata]NPT59719.1 hypothetical protein [Paraburkholderia elongata]
MKQRCFYCSNPATLLCDFRLGLPFGERLRHIDGTEYDVTTIDKPAHTCNMPLCREHAEYRGWLHVNAGKNSHFDSYDYCPEHQGMVDTGAPVMQESEAERLRRVVVANAQRRLMRERGAVRSPPPPPEQGKLF